MIWKKVNDEMKTKKKFKEMNLAERKEFWKKIPKAKKDAMLKIVFEKLKELK